MPCRHSPKVGWYVLLLILRVLWVLRRPAVYLRLADADSTACTHMNVPDRRHGVQRARAIGTVLEQVVVRAVNGACLADVADILPPGSAERILKQLALRGLVRHVDGRWLPRPFLLHPHTDVVDPQD